MYKGDSFRYVLSWGILAVTIPFSGIFFVRMMKNPKGNKNDLLKYTTANTLALAYFAYSAFQHGRVEKHICDKYLGHITMDGL